MPLGQLVDEQMCFSLPDYLKSRTEDLRAYPPRRLQAALGCRGLVVLSSAFLNDTASSYHCLTMQVLLSRGARDEHKTQKSRDEFSRDLRSRTALRAGISGFPPTKAPQLFSKSDLHIRLIRGLPQRPVVAKDCSEGFALDTA
jgi:hypothetical protein